MVNWIHTPPKISRVITWGRPIAQGQLSVTDFEQLSYSKSDGTSVQSDIMAYWPDGSVKWIEHSVTANHCDNQIKLEEHQKPTEDPKLLCDKFNAVYYKDNYLDIKFSKHSDRRNLIDYIKLKDKTIAQNLRLNIESNNIAYSSQVEDIKILTDGFLKSVIRISGSYFSDNRSLNKFKMYVTLTKDTNEVAFDYTFEASSNNSIQSINLTYEVPQSGDLWNRHVGYMGEEDVYYESAQSLLSRRHMKHNALYQRQVNGEKVTPTIDSQLLQHAKENAIWDIFSVVQLGHSYYELTKKTSSDCSEVFIGSGEKYNGSLYYTCAAGATQVFLEKFWEKYPSQISISGLSKNSSTVKIYLWSPKAEPIIFDHYDHRDHMLSAYEGMEEIRSTAVGIANTTQIILKFYEEIPTKEQIISAQEEYRNPAHLIENLAEYHDSKVFGVYSLHNEKYSAVEEQLENLFAFYKNEVKQRNWYGYWNYGDFMHTYDPYRHIWLYDFGGYAWQNTELVPNMWLWLYFLRTGRADVFEIAEAMTRHTSEVDVYHDGEYKGLGSRHNVVHWGCQAKEVRVSMAGLHRYYYYLTANPRIKDVIQEVQDNHHALTSLEPLREFYQSENGLIPIRSGPDWVSLVSNWYTNWELSGNAELNHRILTGISDIYATQNKLLSGPTFLFDPNTYHLKYYGTGNVGGYHMIISFGGPQVWIEYAETTNNSQLKEMIAEFGKFYTLETDQMKQVSEGKLDRSHFAWPMFATSMMAYAAKHLKDSQLATTTWEYLLNPELSGIPHKVKETEQQVATWENINEMPWVTTNAVSQWCLNAILCMELIGEFYPE